MSVAVKHLSALQIDRLLGRAASGDEPHLAHCPDCSRMVDERRAVAAAFRANVLPRTLPVIRARIERRRRTGILGFGAGTLAVAAAAVLLVPAVLHHGPTEDGALVAAKGGPTLRVVARRGESIFPVVPGAALQQGDRIRFVVEPAGYRYLLIASIDGAGKATVFHPWDGSRSAPLPQVARFEIPDSIELDSARGPERLFAIFSRTPVAAPGLKSQLRDIGTRGHAAIRAGIDLADPDQVQLSLLIEKVSP